MKQLMLTFYLLTMLTPITFAQGKLEWSETKSSRAFKRPRNQKEISKT